VPRSIVDHGQGSDWSSPEHELTDAAGFGSLPRWHGEQEGGAGNLVAGLPQAEGRRGELAAVGSEARRWRLVCEAVGGEEVKRGERG
jgi:hypothetical protein